MISVKENIRHFIVPFIVFICYTVYAQNLNNYVAPFFAPYRIIIEITKKQTITLYCAFLKLVTLYNAKNHQ